MSRSTLAFLWGILLSASACGSTEVNSSGAGAGGTSGGNGSKGSAGVSAGADSGAPNSGGSSSAACTPGDTRGCTGPGACAGGQQCEDDGAWGACDCGGAGGATGGGGGSAGATASGGASGVGGDAGSGGAPFVCPEGLSMNCSHDCGGPTNCNDVCQSTWDEESDPPLLIVQPGATHILRTGEASGTDCKCSAYSGYAQVLTALVPSDLSYRVSVSDPAWSVDIVYDGNCFGDGPAYLDLKCTTVSRSNFVMTIRAGTMDSTAGAAHVVLEVFELDEPPPCQ
jgi:hypothetical protein